MAKFTYSISPTGAGTINYSLDSSSYGTLRWTITPASGYSYYTVHYTSGRGSGSFTINSDVGFMPTWPDSGIINFQITFEVAGYFGFFSNIEGGSFSGATSSSPLTDQTNDGSWYSVTGYTYNSYNTWAVTANVPEGYRFIGWYTLSANRRTTNWYQITQAMLSSTALSTSKKFTPKIANLRTFLGESSITRSRQYYLLYAKYDNRWAVSLDQKGGSGGTQSVTATYGQAMPEITVPTRAGYTFLGYFDTDALSGGTQYYTASGASARNWDKSSDATLYARWIGNELICIYNPNGGFCDRYYDRVKAGEVFPLLPTATWGGDVTSRWYTLPTGGIEVHQGDTVTQTEDFTLYAHWNKTETCTVMFNAGEGSASESQRTVNKGAAIGTLPTATWTGHTFNGWFLSSGGGDAITEAYLVDDDLYLYAQWDGKPYTVTFNGNGGTPSQDSISVTYGSQYGTLPTCDQSGKTFLGWFTSETGGTKIESTTIFQQQSDQTLYAHWSDVDPAVKWYYLVSP